MEAELEMTLEFTVAVRNVLRLILMFPIQRPEKMTPGPPSSLCDYSFLDILLTRRWLCLFTLNMDGLCENLTAEYAVGRG